MSTSASILSATITGAHVEPVASRDAFPLLAADPALHYLDSAATAQKPRVVLDALRDYYETANANPHRGAYRLSVAATEAYHAARARVARFVGLADADCLLFVRGTTEAMNLVTGSWGRANVGAGDEVVVTAMDHHATFVAWQQLARAQGATFRIAELTPDGRVDLEHLASLVNARTKVVAFPHVSNALGTVNPVREIVALVRERSNAVLVCDGAQGVPHLPVDFDRLGVDFYAFSGHKVGGPMGIGALLGRRALLEAMPPWQYGGDMIAVVGDQETTWNALPHKFEAGTPNVGDAVGLAAACDFLAGLGMDAVIAHERALVRLAMARLAEIEGLTVHGPAADQRSGVVSFSMADVHPHDLATILDERGVCIRAGHHCAQPLMRRLGVPATARASFWVYSDAGDVDALVDGLQAARRLFGA
ncbi:SufS family cysteine desulfurase [Roseisolibacter agri]|uniref:Cysteine desulfurase n=1 Tax=Roseisolibacter agri TaxID=2014610 RepID=A0AA37Q510_9BACT|nr:SufS family cysteine desulfurase [Roseisolibacter agri]GLC26720.1 cysteine desulfurase [Roseisolibacter agri]